jgi:glycosyltransferase 2 family protein
MTLVSEQAPARSGRPRLIFLLKLVISVALLAWLISRSDTPRLWSYVRSASIAWLATAILMYFLMVVASAWRWGLLLAAQGVSVPARRLTESFLVATFFNNFLPSNIGGDVVRIADTAAASRSRTLAAAVVIVDRVIGLLGLVLLAAVAATTAPWTDGGPLPSWVLWLGFAAGIAVSLPPFLAPDLTVKLLSPLRRIHQEWISARLQQLTGVLNRFRQAPGALIGCFAGAVLVQALLVAFYAAVARGIGIPISAWHMAVIVPVSFLAQLMPISVNGFGVREAVFSYYFSQVGVPSEGGLIVSLLGAALVMLFSLSGAFAYVLRKT